MFNTRTPMPDPEFKEYIEQDSQTIHSILQTIKRN